MGEEKEEFVKRDLTREEWSQMVIIDRSEEKGVQIAKLTLQPLRRWFNTIMLTWDSLWRFNIERVEVREDCNGQGER